MCCSNVYVAVFIVICVNAFCRFGLTPEEAEERGYVYEGNPQVEIFTPASDGDTFQLQLAINTAQYGRTFQDR